MYPRRHTQALLSPDLLGFYHCDDDQRRPNPKADLRRGTWSVASFPETSSSGNLVYENVPSIWLTLQVAFSFLVAPNAQHMQDALCLFFGKAAWLNMMFPQTILATVLVGHRAKTSQPYPMFCPSVGVPCGDPDVKGTPFPGQSCKGLHHPYKTDQMLQY